MNTGGEAAEQIVKMSLEGVEVAARISGAGAKNITILLYSILKEEQKTMGKARLTNMLRSGKELKVFTVKKSDLKKFTQEAKKYGVLYCVLADRGNRDPNAEVDVIARAEDAAKINRIVERFHLASVDTASIVTKAKESRDVKDTAKSQPETGTETQEKEEKEKLLDTLMGKPDQKGEKSPNPKKAETEKSPLSEPTSKQQKKSVEGVILTKAKKTSVKEKLRKIKAYRKIRETEDSQTRRKEKISGKKDRQSTGQTRHRQPQKRKRIPKSKGER